MIYEGEISGIVEKEEKKWLLLDTEKTGKCSKGYSDRCLSLVELGDLEYGRLKEGYIRRALELKSKAMEDKFYQTKNVEILDGPFELYAEKEFFIFVSSRDFIDKFADFYKKGKGAPCLNHVTVEDVRKIEGITSKNHKVVEDTIDMLGRIRAKLSRTMEWRKILKENEIDVALIFPYYNEPTIVPNIRDVWDLVEEGIVREIIVADGWSTDPSVEVIQHRLDAPLTFVKNPGTGKGEALEAAIKYAVYKDIDLVICLDSDIIPPLHTIKDIPPLPIDITCNFFARTFINKFIKILEEHGKEKALETFYKVSYMRVPKSDVKLTPLRFGGTTKFVRYLYQTIGFKTMTECVYPLSGEYGFNPKFLLEELTISKGFHELYGKPFFGHTLPSGFTIENFWNTMIEIKGVPTAFCNGFVHHHIPRGEKVKDTMAYAKQRATVFRGGFGAMLQSMPKEGLEEYIEAFDFDLFRLPRPKMRIELDDNKVDSLEFIE